jgi:GAF domain-containing protein
MSEKSISKAIDNENNVFQSIANTIHHITGLPVSIWAPDENKTVLRIVAAVGLPENYVQTASLDIKKPSVTGDAFKKKKIQIAMDISSDSRWQYKKQAKEMSWKSAICVPFEANGIVMGVVSVYAYTERTISELVHIIPVFAKQVSLTLEADIQKAIFQKILVINEKTQLMSKSPKNVLDAIVKGACELTNADCAVLYPYDSEQDEFYDIKNIAYYGLRKELKLSEKPRSQEGMAAYIKRKGQLILSNIALQDPEMLKTSPFMKREKIRAFMGIALKISGKVSGILYVDFRVPHSFNENEKDAIQLFAHQAAIVINNANLYQRVNTRAKALTRLHKVTPRLISISATPKNLSNLLTQIAKDAQAVLGADLVDLYQYDQDEDDFILPPVQLGKRYTPNLIIDKILADDVVRLAIKGGIQYVKNAQEDKSLTHSFYTRPKSPKERFVVREKLQSVASVPLTVGTELVGVLFANYRNHQTFSQQQRELIELFAGQAAIAIYNSRLYRQAKQQSETLEKLQSIGNDLVSLTGTSKSLRSILKNIAKSAQDVLRADLVDLYQYFEELDKFDLPPVQYGKRYEPQVKKEKIQQDDVILSIVKSKQIQYILDSQVSTNLITPFSEDRTGLPVLRFAEREKVKSTAAIPLIVGSEVVGALFANYRASQTFSSQQKSLIELFAAQAAIAIHNSRIYWESLQRSKRLELVRNVAAAVSSATDVKTILQLAVDGLARVFGVKQSAVALFEDEGEYADVFVEYLEPGCVSAMGGKIPLKNNPQIDRIIETKQPLLVFDIQNDPIMANIRDILAERKTLSLMVIPIIIDDQVVGTIGVDAVGQKRHFTSEEADLAQAIANQAATALRIAQQLDERLNDFHALQDISEQMLQGDLNAMLDLIAERAIRLTRAKHGGVWLINKTRTALEFGGNANKAQHEKLPPNIPLGKNSEGSFGKMVVFNKQSHLSGDVRKDKNYKPWYEDSLSELTVPIIYQDRVIGTINVESPKKNNFTGDHQHLLEAMAGQAAVVVQNARLLERLNVLDDIGVKLTSGTRLKAEEILESIYEQVIQLTGAQDMYIALYNEDSGEIRFPLATQKGKRVEYPTRKADMEKRGKTEEIIFTRKPILHKTKKEAKEWYGQPGHEEKVGIINPSWLGVPMLVGEKVLGVIAIYDIEQEHAYNEQDLQVFSSMASQAAFALVNQELNHRNIALASLNDIAQKLTSGIRLIEGEILESIHNQAQQLTGAQDMYIALYNEDSGEIRFPLATQKGKRVEYPTRKADMEKRGKTEEIIFTRKPILHKTKKEAKEWYGQPGYEEKVGLIQPSWLGVPMLVGEKVLGVLALYDLEKEHAYDEQDLQVYSSMASQAAIALDNANLYYNVNQKLEQANIGLRQAQEREIFAALGEVAAGLIHKMSNTIGHVPALANRIEKSIDPNEEDAIRKLHQIRDGVSDALEYVGSMGKVLELRGFEKREADLSLLISDAIRQTREIIDQNAIKLEEDYADLPVVQVNPPLLIEVFRNIIHNATEAMPSGGLLKIKGIFDNDKIAIQFIDKGSGILEENLRHLFNLGFSTKKEGKGIGLWFSKKVIEQHQGKITVESEKDKGTTFLIHLPVSPPTNSNERFE